MTRIILLLLLGGWFLTLSAQHQSSDEVTEELYRIEGSSATLSVWFQRLEEQGVKISYEVSRLNLAEEITLKTQHATLTQLMEQLLARYDYTLNRVSAHKVLLQIRGEKLVNFYGKIQDGDTGEQLYGYMVVLQDEAGKRYYSIGGTSGLFSFRVPVGNYSLSATSLGFMPLRQQLVLSGDLFRTMVLMPSEIPVKEVVVTPALSKEGFADGSPIDLLAVSGPDPFAQIYALSGVVGTSVSGNQHVNGGESDENMILLDGIPLYHSKHNNSLLSQINGHAVHNISYYDSFIPAQYEGRLSSVTDVRMKQGNATTHHQHVGIDMPSASVAFEGPLVKEKASYLLSGRHSWMDFMENLLTSQPRINRSFYDVSAKVSYEVAPETSLQGFVYTSSDAYQDSIGGKNYEKVLQWDNQIYALTYQTLIRHKIASSHILSYTTYRNEVYAPALGIDLPIRLHEGMNRFNLKSGYQMKLDKDVALSWGLSLSQERFSLLAERDSMENDKQRVTQLSSYANVRMCLTDKLIGNAALNVVGYLPAGHTSYLSLQPRFTLRYFPDRHHIFSIDFSRMGQFYHHISFDDVPIPTDFRMPSINGFRPRSSIHVETAWQYRQKFWQCKLSAYYKRRYHVLGIRYEIAPEVDEWNQFLMKGDASSYGFKFHTLGMWERWLLNLSYTYSRSQEWFPDYQNGKKNPALYNVPHVLNASASYQVGKQSFLTLGGYVESGKWMNVFTDDFYTSELVSGRERLNCNYRLDLNYTGTRNFVHNRLELRYKVGLYNIIGNPKDYELIDLYTVETDKHALPYFSLQLTF